MSARPDWDTYFLAIAETVSLRADCTRRRVGAVIVKHNRIVATGYNGSAPGEPGCLSDGACPRGQMTHEQVAPLIDYESSSCIALHGEINAIAHASYDQTKGATIYVTCQPCYLCDKVIRAAGIDRVVVSGHDV